MDKSFLKQFGMDVAKRKKIHKPSDHVQRWLDNDDKVSFELLNITSWNAEFCINGNKNHIIWYSQLAEIFLLLKNLSLVTGGIYIKNGDAKAVRDYPPEEFAKFVKGKTFRVRVNADGMVARFTDDFLIQHEDDYQECCEYTKKTRGGRKDRRSSKGCKSFPSLRLNRSLINN